MQVPFTFKYAVDALTLDSTGATATAMPVMTLLPATVLLGYGAARAGAALCNEARNAVFAKARPFCNFQHSNDIFHSYHAFHCSGYMTRPVILSHSPQCSWTKSPLYASSVGGLGQTSMTAFLNNDQELSRT